MLFQPIAVTRSSRRLLRLNKHDAAFEDAQLVWSDPFLFEGFDRIEDGEKQWHALGRSAGVVLLLVVDTYPDEDDDAVRIVSAQKATNAEPRTPQDGDL
jgi:uncharacterized DUF497 family protein